MAGGFSSRPCKIHVKASCSLEDCSGQENCVVFALGYVYSYRVVSDHYQLVIESYVLGLITLDCCVNIEFK